VDGDLDVRYAKTVDGLHIAYATLGDGPPDLLQVPGAPTHLRGDDADAEGGHAKLDRPLLRLRRLRRMRRSAARGGEDPRQAAPPGNGGATRREAEGLLVNEGSASYVMRLPA
jgi:hypothetical protein